LPVERGELPLGRFLERPRVHYPGIELVVEVELGGETDPYLEDHTYRGERLFPAVLGLEAMAQAAMALVGTETPPSFAKVRFERPIVVSPGQSLVLRIAALARQPGRVEVVLRTDASAFQVDHFRAECRFGESPAAGHRPWPEEGTVALDVHRDLYGGPLFQSGRFHRVAGYRALEARACRAEIAPAQGAVQWFGRFLPQALVLGDPGARDAALHGIQACIPHRTVLPVAVDRIELYPLPEDEGHHLEAREREQRGDLLIYDLDIHGSGGVERWQGLRLRAVAETPPPATWPPALLAPYLERTLAERFGAAGVRIGLVGAGEGREELVRRLAGTAEPTLRRSDGKSELADGRSLSLAHAGPLVLGVIGPETLGCDLEPVAERSPEVWADLLGPERRRLADVLGGDAEAATRVWTALECCKKAGLGVGVPLVVREQGDGWVVLGCGERVIATWCGRLAGQTVVAAVLYRPAPEDDTAAPRARPAASTRAPVEGAHAEL
jgi:enediyne polyketide synthase